MSGLGSSPETQNKISKANSSNDMLTKVSGDFKTRILLQFCIRIFKKTSMIFKVQGVPGIVLGCQIRQKLVFVECIPKSNVNTVHDFQKKPSCQRIKDTLRSSDFCVSFRELSSTKKPVQHTPVSSPSLGPTTRVKHTFYLISSLINLLMSTEISI